MNILYTRVSTEAQAASGLGLEAQRFKVAEAGITIDVEYCDSGVSGKNTQRPELQKLFNDVKADDNVFVSRLCRLSRSVADFARICEVATTQGWNLVILDPQIDLRTPTGRLTANVLASVVQFERDMVSTRTKEALAEKRKQGTRLGRPLELDGAVRERILDMYQDGFSYSAIARQLSSMSIPSARGGKWTHSNVKAAINVGR